MVLVRKGPELNLVMLLTNLSSTMTLSWQAWGANTCRKSGERGSFSPGAVEKEEEEGKEREALYPQNCTTKIKNKN